MYAPREALGVRDTDLSSLLLSIFTAYADRPCIGQPVAREPTEHGAPVWEWHSYQDVLALALRYRVDLQQSDCEFMPGLALLHEEAASCNRVRTAVPTTSNAREIMQRENPMHMVNV